MNKIVQVLVVTGTFLALGAGCASTTTKAPADTPADTPADDTTPAEDVVDNSAWKVPTAEDTAVPCPTEFVVVPFSSSLENADPWVGPVSNAAAFYTDEGALELHFANFALGTTKDEINWAAASEDGEIASSFALKTKNGSAIVPGFYAHVDEEETTVNLLLEDPGIGYDYGEGSGGVGFLEVETSGVKVTQITADQVCGVVMVDDGYATITGAFTAPIVK